MNAYATAGCVVVLVICVLAIVAVFIEWPPDEVKPTDPHKDENDDS